MNYRLIKYFIISSLMLLSITATAKIFSAFGNQPILWELDPIFGISNHKVIIAAALMEILVILLIIFIKKPTKSCIVIGILGGEFLLYRLSLKFGHFPQNCPCLGTIGQIVHIPDNVVNVGLWITALYLCIGGFAVGYISWKFAGE
jgi:hypothetical protein